MKLSVIFLPSCAFSTALGKTALVGPPICPKVKFFLLFNSYEVNFIRMALHVPTGWIVKLSWSRVFVIVHNFGSFSNTNKTDIPISLTWGLTLIVSMPMSYMKTVNWLTLYTSVLHYHTAFQKNKMYDLGSAELVLVYPQEPHIQATRQQFTPQPPATTSSNSSRSRQWQL